MFDAAIPLATSAQIGHPALAEIHAYWVERADGRWAPARADLDPVDLGRLLPHIALIEPLDAGADFKLRLIGSHILEGYCLNPAPKLLSDLPGGPIIAAMHAQYRRVVAERHALHYGPAASLMPGRGHMTTEHIDMPLSSDGTNVDMILAGVAIFGGSQWGRWRPPGADPATPRP